MQCNKVFAHFKMPSKVTPSVRISLHSLKGKNTLGRSGAPHITQTPHMWPGHLTLELCNYNLDNTHFRVCLNEPAQFDLE